MISMTRKILSKKKKKKSHYELKMSKETVASIKDLNF